MFAKRETTFKKNFIRVNFQIKAPSVRVIREDEQLGIMPIEKARKTAQDLGLDLVEVVPQAKPPVCKIIDYAKFRYEKDMKEKEQRKKQKVLEVKEIRLGANTNEHDIEVKVKSASKFLSEDKKVKLSLLFKKREIMHKENGFKIIEKVISSLEEIAKVEIPPKLEGKRITCILSKKEK